jgi:hypothetical protein
LTFKGVYLIIKGRVFLCKLLILLKEKMVFFSFRCYLVLEGTYELLQETVLVFQLLHYQLNNNKY